jgi:hypothetical protein
MKLFLKSAAKNDDVIQVYQTGIVVRLLRTDSNNLSNVNEALQRPKGITVNCHSP